MNSIGFYPTETPSKGKKKRKASAKTVLGPSARAWAGLENVKKGGKGDVTLAYNALRKKYNITKEHAARIAKAHGPDVKECYESAERHGADKKSKASTKKKAKK